MHLALALLLAVPAHAGLFNKAKEPPPEPVAEPAEPAAPVPPPSRCMAPPPQPYPAATQQIDDVRELANAWAYHFNTAVDHVNAQRFDKALKSADAALALAPNAKRPEVDELRALAAEALGDDAAQFVSLDRILEAPDIQWGVFWNGFMDAAHGGDVSRACAYGMRALRDSDTPAELAPFVAEAALGSDALDEAVEAVGYFGPERHPLIRQAIATKAAAYGRCDVVAAVGADVPCG